MTKDLRSPVTLHDTDNSTSGQNVFRLLLGLGLHVHLLLLCLSLLPLGDASRFVVISVIITQCDCRSVPPAAAASSLTILVDDLLSGCLPFGLGENFDDNNVSINGPVHVFPSDKQNRLFQARHVDTALYV